MRAGLLLVLSCLLGGQKLVAQSLPAKHKQDTLRLARYEWTSYVSDNGTTCVYSIRNADTVNTAIIVTTGGPDSLMFTNRVLFNGMHELSPGEQIISAGDFEGKQISIINLSVRPVSVIILFFCPQP